MTYCFTGEWANDAPNGYGECLSESESIIACTKGNYTDGLENGTMTDETDMKDIGKTLYRYTATNGKVPIIKEEHGRYVIAYNELNNSIGYLSVDNSDMKWGISPWNTDVD